jgi:hypothetical protein
VEDGLSEMRRNGAMNTRTILAGVAALLLATGVAANASIHRSFHQCGKYLITNAWSWDKGDSFSLVVNQNKSFMEENNMRRLPSRLVKSRGPDLYYRGQKCHEPAEDVKATKWPG